MHLTILWQSHAFIDTYRSNEKNNKNTLILIVQSVLRKYKYRSKNELST